MFADMARPTKRWWSVMGLGGAKAPWLTLDAAAAAQSSKRINDLETGRFSSGALLDGTRDTAENVKKCQNCPYPECCNCLSGRRTKSAKRKQTAAELADSLRIHRCEEAEE